MIRKNLSSLRLKEWEKQILQSKRIKGLFQCLVALSGILQTSYTPAVTKFIKIKNTKHKETNIEKRKSLNK
jgi:hypothetical protein